MHHLAIKGIVGAVGAVSVAGIVKLSINTSKSVEEPKIISKLLGERRPDRRLLLNGYQDKGDGSPSAGQFAWKKYVGDHTGLKSNPFSLTLTNTPVNAPIDFMNACKKLFDEKVLNHESEKYTLALEYCTRDALVSDGVGVKGKKLATANGNSLGNKYKSSRRYKWEPSSIDSDLQRFKNKCTSEYSIPAESTNSVSVLRILEYCSEDRPRNS